MVAGQSTWASTYLSYTSVKLIQVYNPTLAILYYVTGLLLLTYVVVYTVVLQKGYQTYDTLVGSSMIKVKGSAHIGYPDNATVYDQYDLVVPPLQPDAVFVTTNFIYTVNQSRGTCDGNLAGDPSDPFNPVKSELCNCSLYGGDVSQCCRLGEHTENGMKLGYCGAGGVYCAMNAWCPLEQAPVNPNVNILDDVRNFTIFIRANIRFPNFNVSRSNTAANITIGSDLFYISDIIQKTGFSFDDVKGNGCVVLATFEFNCDLNQGEDQCNPSINFIRLDSTTSTASTGFNYRYTWQYRDIPTGILTRDLVKVYGVNLILQMYGEAGKFSIVALTITLGSGLAILSLSTLFCDIVMQFILPGHRKYTQEKYHIVRDAHDEEQDGASKLLGDTEIAASARDYDNRSVSS